jgi:heme oxygenase
LARDWSDRHFRLLARAIPEDREELIRLGAMEGRHARDVTSCGSTLGVRPDVALAKRLFAPLHAAACHRTVDRLEPEAAEAAGAQRRPPRPRQPRKASSRAAATTSQALDYGNTLALYSALVDRSGGCPSSVSPPAMTTTHPGSISDHANQADAALRKGFGPRMRRLHARIGKAHHQAEGMTFSKALLEGRATPLQLAALLRALAPAYTLLDQQVSALAPALGATSSPWLSLARSTALEHDLAKLAALPDTPCSPAASSWLEQLDQLAQQAPHRLMAHVYVRYGGDLSGGQQLAQQANAILAVHGLPALSFWAFDRPIPELKQALHDAFEQFEFSAQEEEELLEEAEAAFRATQRLLAELAELPPA